MTRVFIVEDEAIVAMELKDHLRELGYDVCGHALRGESALRQILEVRPDLVLMDINLGGEMTGLDVAERLREVVDTPLLFITAYSDAELTERAGRSGSFAYIVKPFEPQVLRANIELALARHEATIALRASEARFRELFEHAPDGILIADSDGRCTDINEAGIRMLGYSRDEIAGKTITDIIPGGVERGAPEEPPVRGGTRVAECHLRRKDGSWLPVEVSAKILAEGRWQGFLRDITERKLAQAQLRQSQERFELALRGADLGAWDWNIETGEVIVNARWAEMRGYSLGEVEPHVDSWISGVHPDDWPHVQRALADYFAGTTSSYETEHRVMTRSGAWIWVLDRGKVFERDENGRPIRMVGTELDITERKRSDEELRSAAEARENLLAVVSHDLRNPLAAIQMSAGGLARARTSGEPSGVHKSVDVILRSAARMRRLIDDLLQAATIEAGKFTVEPGLEAVPPIIEETLQSHEATAMARSVRLRREVPETLPPIRCDRLRLIQVLSNLIGNAIKFVPAGGTVQVRAWAQAGEVCFAVRDDGPGIAADQVPHIFDRYWKGEAEGRRGVGLGLYIARGIVEAHGGRIWVESQVGVGSTFFFTIPTG